jgi:hypothetical protein
MLTSCDVGGVGGFFDSLGDGFGHAFVEDRGDNAFGIEFIFGVQLPDTAFRP